MQVELIVNFALWYDTPNPKYKKYKKYKSGIITQHKVRFHVKTPDIFSLSRFYVLYVLWYVPSSSYESSFKASTTSPPHTRRAVMPVNGLRAFPWRQLMSQSGPDRWFGSPRISSKEVEWTHIVLRKPLVQLAACTVWKSLRFYMSTRFPVQYVYLNLAQGSKPFQWFTHKTMILESCTLYSNRNNWNVW